MQIRHAFVLLGLLAGVAVGPSPISAQLAPAPPTPAETAVEIQRIVQQAVGLWQGGNQEEARALLGSLPTASDLPPQARALIGAIYAEIGPQSKALELLAPLADSANADPAVLYNAGRAAVAEAQLERGEGYLRRSLELEPGTPATLALGILLASTGRCQEAYPMLFSWLPEPGEDPEASLVAALCAVELHRPPDVEKFLAPLSGEDPRVQLLQAKLLLLRSDPNAAIAVLEPLLENHPPSMELDVRRTLADVYAGTGSAQKAIGVLEGKVGDNPEGVLQLALAKYQTGDLVGAASALGPVAGRFLDHLAQQVSAPPGYPPAILVEYGRFLALTGKQEDSLPYLYAATRVDPDNRRGWQQLGQSLAAVGRREEAREALDRFQKIVEKGIPSAVGDIKVSERYEDPVDREIRSAFRYMLEGDYDKALEMARREAVLAPEDPRPRLLEARVLLEAEQLIAAQAVSQRLLEQFPGHPDALYISGAISIAVQDLEQAEALLRGALEAFPDHTAALNDLAVLLMESGRKDEARTLLERAIELRPHDSLAAENLQKLDQ
ncbi:MAG: tetratricopeptide repeat protein [Thermoanaerobaculia bacterium]